MCRTPEHRVAREQQTALHLLPSRDGGHSPTLWGAVLVNSTLGWHDERTMRGRCAWTNRDSDQLKEIILVAPNRLGLQPTQRAFHVLPEFEPALRRHIERLRRFGLLFVLSVLLLTIALVMAAALQQLVPIAVMIALIGVLLIAFPFATPETVALLGFRKSIILVRCLGVGVLVLAVWLFTMKRG